MAFTAAVNEGPIPATYVDQDVVARTLRVYLNAKLNDGGLYIVEPGQDSPVIDVLIINLSNWDTMTCINQVSEPDHPIPKEEKRCLTNTFVLHPSELTQSTQGSFQYFVKEVIKRPRTCSEVKQNDPASVEGHYWLFPEASSLYGNRVRIYCHNMTETTPLEYISLLNPNVGVFPALRNADCTNEVVMSSGYEGTTTFYKVKVMVDSVRIVTNNYDYTFANWTGKRYPYGAAGDCYSPQSLTQKGPCGPVGSFHINFDGTGLRTYGKTSWRASNDTNISFKASSSSNIKVICGGLCGYCYIDGPGLTLTVNREEMIDQDSAIVVV